MLTCKRKNLKHVAVATATLLALSTLAAGMADARGGGGGMRGGGGGGFSRGGGGGGGFSRGGGGGGFSGGGGGRSAPTSIDRGGGGGNFGGANANRANYSGGNRTGNGNFNGNTYNRNNVQINGDNGWNHGCCGGYGGYAHPVAAGMAVGAVAGVTAAAIGSMAYSLPPGCSPYGGYYNCGGTYYQPQYSGSDVTYVVVNNPG